MRPSLLVLGLVACSAAGLLLAAAPPAAAPVGEAASVDWADCLACHSVAGADLPTLSQLRPEGLGPSLPINCSACHSEQELRAAPADWRHPLRPLALHVACTDCHLAVPHSATQPPPAPAGDYTAAGCYTCHPNVRAQRRMAYSHAESATPRCRDCHPPHTPQLAALPAVLVPTLLRRNWEAQYDWERSNSGCLACHPPGRLMLDQRTGFATLNTENYHERHTVSGRVLCIECHAPHGSPFPALLRSKLLTGESLSFQRGSMGGSCSTTCHGVEHTGWEYRNGAY